jgi:hypothetical protein
MPHTEVFEYPILAEAEMKDDLYIHLPCGSTIMAMNVHHPIWLKEFTCAGGGDVSIEVVPYCPTCGPIPSSAGTPIIV